MVIVDAKKKGLQLKEEKFYTQLQWKDVLPVVDVDVTYNSLAKEDDIPVKILAFYRNKRGDFLVDADKTPIKCIMECIDLLNAEVKNVGKSVFRNTYTNILGSLVLYLRNNTEIGRSMNKIIYSDILGYIYFEGTLYYVMHIILDDNALDNVTELGINIDDFPNYIKLITIILSAVKKL